MTRFLLGCLLLKFFARISCNPSKRGGGGVQDKRSTMFLQLLLQLCVNLRVVSFHWDWEKNLKKFRGLNCLVVLLLLQCVHKQISEKCRLGYAKIMDSCWLLQVTWLFWVNQSVLFQHSYTSLIFVYVIGSCLYLEVS